MKDPKSTPENGQTPTAPRAQSNGEPSADAWRQNWIEVDPEMVPADERAATRFCNEAQGKVQAAAWAAGADSEDVAAMAIAAAVTENPQAPDVAKAVTRAKFDARSCAERKRHHLRAGYLPQSVHELCGDDDVEARIDAEKPSSSHPWRAPQPPPPYARLVRAEGLKWRHDALAPLPRPLQLIALKLDRHYNDDFARNREGKPPRTTQKSLSVWMAAKTGRAWSEDQIQRSIVSLREYFLKNFPDEVRKFTGEL